MDKGKHVMAIIKTEQYGYTLEISGTTINQMSVVTADV
jgi:hypothetical protein